MKTIFWALLLNITFAGSARADTVSIRRFVIKENPFAQKEVAIVATDTANQILERINGLYTFTINGFENQLKFENGTAFYRHKVDKSAFMYIKHKNESGTSAALYYVYKHGDRLSPMRISWVWMIMIPLALVFIAYIFKRFIIIAAVILIIFIYFNHSKGLSIPTFFESIFDGLKGIVIGS
jgi:glycosyltransferase involved in cell wall biosynthesis